MTTKVLLLASFVVGVAFIPPTPQPDEAVYEIRNYHIQPDQLENYKTWIETHGLPYIRSHMEVIGFWVKGDIDAEVNGAPLDEMGSANVTWVIRWDSKAARDETMQAVFGGQEWQDIFAKFPGGSEAYLRVENKFFQGI